MRGTDSFCEYNPHVNMIFFASAIILSIVISHPVYLGMSLLFAFCYAFSVRPRRALKLLLRMAVLMVLISVISPLFNPLGDSVLFTYLNGRTYTLESLVCGASQAMMAVSILTWFSSYSEVMTSDRFMYIFSPLAPALCLVLTMVLRLIPSYQRKAVQISSCRRSVGKGAGDGTRKEKISSAMTVLGALTSWALEGAVISADSMKSRGYGTVEKRSHFSNYRFDGRDLAVLVLIICLLSGCIYMLAQGAASAVFYPSMEFSGLSSLRGIVSIVIYGLLMAVPFIINIKEKLLWHYSISGI